MGGASTDIVIVGGGLGGAALAKVMAEAGASVIVLERETQFRDRVRGEYLNPWGVAEARTLGLDSALKAASANDAPWIIGLGPDRELTSTTPQSLPSVTFFHPDMQEAMLAAAEVSGAQVRRGVRVTGVAPGAPARVEYETNGGTESISARLIVGADGRSSNVRNWGDFPVSRDKDRLIIAGVLLEGGRDYRADAGYWFINPVIAQTAFAVPQGSSRLRAYLILRSELGTRLQGNDALPQLVEGAVQSGAPREFFEGARPIGPLASFSGADHWVDHPYRRGIALIGDAAAASDPSWGQGLCLTLRDVRALRDALLANEDWEAAGDAYAREHDRYYRVLHTWEDWYALLFYERGDEADARRARALPLLSEDPTRIPDYPFGGPDLPFDDGVRRRFFGED
jgi:menaquinone-9 beta-reductase